MLAPFLLKIVFDTCFSRTRFFATLFKFGLNTIQLHADNWLLLHCTHIFVYMYVLPLNSRWTFTTRFTRTAVACLSDRRTHHYSYGSKNNNTDNIVKLAARFRAKKTEPSSRTAVTVSSFSRKSETRVFKNTHPLVRHTHAHASTVRYTVTEFHYAERRKE